MPLAGVGHKSPVLMNSHTAAKVTAGNQLVHCSDDNVADRCGPCSVQPATLRNTVYLAYVAPRLSRKQPSHPTAGSQLTSDTACTATRFPLSIQSRPTNEYVLTTSRTVNRRPPVYCKRFTIQEPTDADARARKLQFRERHVTLYVMESQPVCSTFDSARSRHGISRLVGVHQDSGDGVAASTECVKSCHDRDLQGRTVPAE